MFRFTKSQRDSRKSPNSTDQTIRIARHAYEASAEVLSVVRTNMSPVVEMKLLIAPASGAAFEVTSRVMVPDAAIPRKGDIISVNYSPADPSLIRVNA